MYNKQQEFAKNIYDDISYFLIFTIISREKKHINFKWIFFPTIKIFASYVSQL